jgi:hypothetical protein
MNLKLAILSIFAVAATALQQSDDQHQFRFRATESALRTLLKREKNKNKSDEDIEHDFTRHVLRGSGRSLRGIECGTSTCNKDTEECTDESNNKCEVVCIDKDCEGHAECKDGECECKKPWEGSNCDRKKIHVDVEYSIEFNFAEDSLDRCVQLLSNLGEDIQALEDDAATSFTTTLTVSSGGSGSKDSYDIDVTVTAELGNCEDRTVALASIVAAIEDVSVPSNLSKLSRWSRD